MIPREISEHHQLNKNMPITSDLTFVATIRDRDRDRVEKFLNSIALQKYPCNAIVVDYGSLPQNTDWEREIIPSEFTEFIEVTEDISVFNKCRALNIGIKRVRTKYMVSTDIDCIFSDNFAEEIMRILIAGEKEMALCQKIDLDEHGQEIGLHEPSAVGSCIALPTKWVKKVHGYDEKFTYWGREDNDMVQRAMADNFRVTWITNIVKLYHQWHEPPQMPTLQNNDDYYKIPNKPIIRNPGMWGEL